MWIKALYKCGQFTMSVMFYNITQENKLYQALAAQAIVLNMINSLLFLCFIRFVNNNKKIYRISLIV